MVSGKRNKLEIKVQENGLAQSFAEENQDVTVDDEITNNTQLTPTLTKMELDSDEIGNTCGT